ncbi:MAG: hypothetical protein HQ518_19795 [Rhodopirellula sp.]|nr:hypothetical protein [Rhodopirellula sp.]
MKLILSFIAAAALFTAPLAAREVPFDAIVSSDNALVRGGAGEKDYYPTQKLSRGSKIRVVREGYGGWYMIEPPEGSHSWVRAEFVKRRGQDKGIITESTVDRIGSLLDRSNLSIIHKLVEGEVVTILGTATMRSGDKPVEMLKIAPPRGEYRYINRKDVTPADEYSSQPSLLASSQTNGPSTSGRGASSPDSRSPESSSDSTVATGPFGEPISTGSRETSTAGPAGSSDPGGNAFDLNRSLADSGQHGSTASSKGFQELNQLPGSARQGISMPGVRFESPQPLGTTLESEEDQATVEQAWQNVMQTDGQFRQMLKRPVSQWNLASLKQVYQQSADQIANPSLKRQIESRIAAVDRYQKLYADQIAIERILAQTETRDAEIRQQYIAKWHSVSTTNPPTTRILKPAAIPTQVRPAQTRPTTAGPKGTLTGVPTTSVPAQTAAPAKFAGAGIVQRSALSRPGLPAHVLLAPDGRVLSYLQSAPGINLDQHLGKSVGITGPRSFRRELNSDLMIVRGLTPVNLQP